MIDIKQLIERYQDTPESHSAIHNELIEKTNLSPALKSLRDWVETKIFGFGERSFYWMFKLITQTQKRDFIFLEVGVFRGQTLALIKMLRPDANVMGITPLDNTDGHWESDYAADIKLIHETFKLPQPIIIKGLSTDAEVLEHILTESVDIVYIDGGHSYEVVKQDMANYPKAVKTGGYLVVDDCCNNLNIPMGMFAGIQSVTQAVTEWEATQTEFKFLFSVVHIKVYQKI